MNEIFKNHPELEKYYETSDGTAFYNESNARNHARTLEDKTVKAVNRNPETKEPEKKKQKPKNGKPNPFESAKLRIEAINELNTVEEVEQALSEETAKTVLKAGAERIAALKAEEALNNEDGTNVNVEIK